MATRIIKRSKEQEILEAFDYDNMPRAQLIEHCKAYSKAIHELVRDAQELRFLKAWLDENRRFPLERMTKTA